MNLTGFFVGRPVTTSLVMAALVIFGLISYRLLPVSALPNVDFPTIQVSANLAGASPETMASAVALPLEKQFSTIAGLDSMSSESSQGSTRVTLQFNLERDLDAAAQDVQSAITAAQRRLPDAMTTPPSYRKVNPAEMPIFYLALASDSLPATRVSEFADVTLSPRLSTINGVAQVQVFGFRKAAVRIKVDPNLLAARGIGLDEVAAAIPGHNPQLPTGSLRNDQRTVDVRSSGGLTDAAGFRALVLFERNGLPVRLGDVARVVDGVENEELGAWFNGRDGVVLAVQRQPGANTIAVADAILAMLPQLREQMPPGIGVEVLFDRSQSIRESVRDVQLTLLLAFVLVVLVIYLFLGDRTATFIASTALPVAIIGVFPAMLMLDYSVNNLTLMALTLCVGFVVDDAIVMLENISRHREMGKDAMTATLDGGREIAFTIVSMTLSLGAVFLPVVFMGGIMGRLLHEFAVTIMVSVALSGVVALSLTPMLCSRYLKPHQPGAGNWLLRTSDAAFARLRRGYEKSLDVALRHRGWVLVLFVALLGGSAWEMGQVPKGFLPSEDTGQLFCFTEAEQEIGFEAMAARQRLVAEVVRADPAVDTVMSFVGSGGASQSVNMGRVVIRLKPRGERPSADVVMQRLRPKLSAIPGIRAFMQNLAAIRIGGMLTKSQYQYALQGSETGELYQWAPRLEERLKARRELQNVTSNLSLTKPAILVNVDRERAAQMGINAEAVERALYDAYGGLQVSTIFTPSNQYDVILEVDAPFREDIHALSRLHVRSNQGVLVPIATVAELKAGVGPASVTHLGQMPAVTLSFDLAPGYALSHAVAIVEEERAALAMPGALSGAFQGTAQAFQSSLTGMGWLVLLAILVIYLVLGMLYESFIHPLTILSGLPAAGLGALLTLHLFGVDLDMYGFVGLILLVGIVKKNAIMMIDFALEAQRKQGLPSLQAIRQAAVIRFRPIMMTTMAALMGALPIALGWGAGGDARRPMGLAVVGGLLLSQWLTLYLTPVIYLALERFRR